MCISIYVLVNISICIRSIRSFPFLRASREGHGVRLGLEVGRPRVVTCVIRAPAPELRCAQTPRITVTACRIVVVNDATTSRRSLRSPPQAVCRVRQLFDYV